MSYCTETALQDENSETKKLQSMDRKERNVATGELYRARVLSTRKTWLPTAGVPCVANLTNQHPSLKFHRLLRFHHEPWILDLGDRFEKLVGSQAYKKVLFSRVGAIEKAFMQAGQGAFASSLPKRGKCSGFIPEVLKPKKKESSSSVKMITLIVCLKKWNDQVVNLWFLCCC